MEKNPIQITKINKVLTVITQPVLDANNATLGFWCDGGSWKENDKNNGIAHALEHMMFKGTHTYNSKEIARKLEELGCYSNAYTSEESVAYYLSVAPTINNGNDNLMDAIKILFDMFLNSTFPEEELHKEKDVIVQEIRMYQDSLSSRCLANLHSIAYDPHTYLHREIIGTEEIVKSFTPNQLKQFMKDHYNKIYFVIVGNFNTEAIINYCKSMGDYFDKMFTPTTQIFNKVDYIEEYREKIDIKNWANQAQCIMSWPSTKTNDPEEPVAQLVSGILGNGMSSILFEKIREDMGLVYGISSYINDYADNGFLSIQFKTFNDKVDLVIETVNEEVKNLLNNLTDKQIQTAKNLIVSARIKRYETNANKCFFLGESALRTNGKLNIDEYIYECNKVTKSDIAEYCKKYLNKPADKISKILIQ